MSWTAYIRPITVLLIALLIATALYSYQQYLVAGVIAVFFLILTIYQIFSIRSVSLYADEEGVWVYSGILPWSKGTSGVKWRDVDEAVFFTGFWSWLLRSYTIRVGHRFTKDSEIVLPHIAHGKDAVQRINELHRTAIANGNNL
ncbi:hypothetical protein [Herminiimonas contaminans]|uniref:PH (Pleckstrin Homology) domain-containing protein n=1 Tax=Herminiimonas contaminans TaxID=1111140 RepID=A0ABS0EQ14_9BURK|nr:hypothetical protein [Herminiimonas contaminans]MBF8176926.1 hypothetical protein [Herminiimonas contaminans]